jgi:hypothetical protein
MISGLPQDYIRYDVKKENDGQVVKVSASKFSSPTGVWTLFLYMSPVLFRSKKRTRKWLKWHYVHPRVKGAFLGEK